jgi:hypothetical protein
MEDFKKEVQSRGYLPLELRRWLSPAEIWNGGSHKKPILAALEQEIEELTKRKV